MQRLLSAGKHFLLRFVDVKPTNGTVMPDFLGIGVPQAATTWLYENLRRHPDLYLPDDKELEYFNKRFYLPLSHYARRFEPGRGKIKGEITPAYCIMPRDQIETVYRMKPDLRLILILRDPVERVWSATRRLLGWQYGGTLAGLPDSAFREMFDRQPVRERTAYGRMLDNWLAVFPRDQLLTLFFYEVRENPRGVLTRVFEHLGAATDVDWSLFNLERKVNANPVYPIPERFRDFLQRRYSGVVESVRERLGEAVTPWLRSNAI